MWLIRFGRWICQLPWRCIGLLLIATSLIPGAYRAFDKLVHVLAPYRPKRRVRAPPFCEAAGFFVPLA